jgi:hypothetical protein
MAASKQKAKPSQKKATKKDIKQRKQEPANPAAHSATRKELQQRILIQVFRSHWRAVNAKLLRGIDVAQRRTEAFYATHEKERSRIAYRHYAPARVKKLATASDEEILRMTEIWFNASCENPYSSDDPSELRKELRELVIAEYVGLVCEQGAYEFPEDGSATASPLPNKSVMYGDIYEMTASGFSSGARLRICKSTGEAFLKSERREAEAGIEREFYENAREDGHEEPDEQWSFSILDNMDQRAIDMDICENFDYEPTNPDSDSEG